MMCCEKCAFLYLKKIRTKNIEEGVCGTYDRYGCKKGRMNLSGIFARKDLQKQGCGAFRKKEVVLIPGDCLEVNHDTKYIYLGTVGKFYKKRLLYTPNGRDYIVVDNDFLKEKNFTIYSFLPEYAEKRRKRYFEKIRGERCDN